MQVKKDAEGITDIVINNILAVTGSSDGDCKNIRDNLFKKTEQHITNLYNFVKSPLLVEDKNDLKNIRHVIAFFVNLQNSLLATPIKGEDIALNNEVITAKANIDNIHLAEALEYARAKCILHENKTINVTALATLAGIGYMAIIQHIRRGNLEAHKIGNVWTIDSAVAKDWLLNR